MVRQLWADAKQKGSGQHYLIQHSAGSGKSNSIAWLAYRLFSLHNAIDEKVFNSLIVITDRRVLDKQLQDTIYQFEHKQGVVVRVDKSSGQLAEAVKRCNSVIITTLQKFLFAAVLDEVKSIEKFIDRMDINNSTTSSILNNEKLADAVIFKYLAKYIYDKIYAA